MYPTNDQQLNFETEKAVYFFIHGLDPLNNWSAHAVHIWGKTFKTVEHAYHYRKFFETAPEVAEAILNSPSPWAAMQVDRTHKTRRVRNWQDAKAAIMLEIVRAKVLQNEDVRHCLLATGDKRLIENAPWDSFWGCGADGKGENTAGKILMKIREEIRASAS